MSTQIAQGMALGARYRIHARSGTVDSTETRAETEVSGNISGGGGGTYQGTGYAAPVRGSIQSKTTRYQHIFLTDGDGIEHNIQLVNFLVPCKEGQKLTMLGITAGSSNGGEYFRAYNHNTREHSNHPKGVISTMFPWKVYLLGMGGLALLLLIKLFTDDSVGLGEALFLSLIILTVAGLLLGAAGWILAYLRSISVRSNSTLKTFVRTLEDPGTVSESSSSTVTLTRFIRADSRPGTVSPASLSPISKS